MLSIKVDGVEYELSTSLRVVSLMQGSFDIQRPYMETIRTIMELSLEEQIRFIYLALIIKNPELKKTLSKVQFEDYMLDNSNLTSILATVKILLEGIMFSGDAPEEIERKKALVATAMQQ